MRVIGFNFTKISAEKFPDFKRCSMNTNIEFTNLEKEKVDILKDQEAIKLSFKYSVNYEEEKEKKEDNNKKLGEVSFEGIIVFSVTKEESKQLQKSWKKKQISPAIQIPIYNFILTKCSPKAVSLEDDLALPIHLPVPQIKPKQDN